MEDSVLHVHIEIPFPSQRLAEIAYHVLRVDAEPKRGITKDLKFEGNVLKAKYSGAQFKQVRVAVNSFFDNVSLVTETFDFAGDPVSDSYDHF